MLSSRSILMRQGVGIDALKLPKKLTVRSMFYMGVGDSCQGKPTLPV